jgi:outer membrane protein assembly factor BamB
MKPNISIRSGTAVVLLGLLSLCAVAGAAEVGGFRGPQRNGMFPATNLLKKWPEGGPKLLWEAQVGRGWTAAGVADGKVFFCGADEGNPSTGVMRAFDLDGKELWKTDYGPDKAPRATPAVAEGRVFYESLGAVVYALDAKTGKVLWSFDMAKVGDSLAGCGGNSGSPLVLGDRVIVTTRSAGDEVPSFVALECATGKVAWLGNLAPTPEKGKGWSSFHGTPIAVRVGNRDAVFGNFFRGAGAVWADTGDKFWVDSIVKVKNRGQVQIVSNEGYLFLHGTVMAKIGEDGKIAPLWEGKIKVSEYNISYSHTLIKDGRLLAFTPAGAMNPTAPGRLVMLDAQTGKELASLAAAAKGSFIWADGLIYLLDNRPAMVLIEATKDSLHEVSSFKPPLGKYATGSGIQLFTHPVIAEGRLFLRDQSKVLVYDLRERK